ncbi:MAG TPA: peptidoglycan-binding domain-containing protein [Solirubrobacteraceae bacterium]|nr:peptidoglycan-binding domain-containing protein [Solirubrobacteraceae bacterium]
MEYCGNCGEPSEGRYCRMCGTPLSTESTQAMAAVPAGVAYAYEPTPSVGPLPMATTQPPSEFDSLFRTPDGAPGLHGQTQVLPPMVETDYRMRPPGGGQIPPDPYEDDEERSSRPVLFATVGAVVIAAAVILGLLYLGNKGTSGSGTAASSAMQTGSASASMSMGASQTSGVVAVPTQSAVATSAAATTSSAAAATTSAASQFQGDNLPLGVGSQGNLVTWVQGRLSDLGYYQGSVNGVFDQATALAVQQFQAAEGVTGDPASTVGQHTRLALVAAGPSPSLNPGDRSSDVVRLNQSLYYAEGANLSGSRYTTTTAAAVAFYQQAVGISPSGVMDAATWAKLQTGTLAGSTFSGGSQG